MIYQIEEKPDRKAQSSDFEFSFVQLMNDS